MSDHGGFWFISDRFEVEPGEDLETNPGMFGKQLSHWLRDKLDELGYEDPDAFGEDWGWAVTCRSGPYRLMVGCGVFADASVYDSTRSEPDAGDLLWYVFPVVTLPFRERIKGELTIGPVLAKLEQQLQETLDAESDIELVDEPEGGDWSVPPASAAFLELEPPAPRRPMSAWISVPLGLLIALFVPIMVIAVHEVVYYPPAGREVTAISLSAIIIAPTIVMVFAAIRLVIVPLRQFDHALVPLIMRVVALAILAIPFWTIYAGYFSTNRLAFFVQLVLHMLIAAMLWRAARKRALDAV